MKKEIKCPKCGASIWEYANPKPTVDSVIYHPDKGVVIIKRKNIPHGYALPGGFIDEGEQAENAAIRETLEETGLRVRLKGLLGVYSRPDRDPRSHTMSSVYVCETDNPEELKAGDDAGEAAFYPLDKLPEPIVFDHAKIIDDFREYLAGKRTLAPVQPT